MVSIKKNNDFVTKGHFDQVVSDLRKDMKKFLTREEYLNSADRIMGELKAIREENIVLADMKRQVNNHEERIEIVEEKLHISQIAA